MTNKLVATTITLTLVLSAPAFAGWRAEIAKGGPVSPAYAIARTAPKVIEQTTGQMAEACKNSGQACLGAQTPAAKGPVSGLQAASTSTATPLTPAGQPQYAKVLSTKQPFHLNPTLGGVETQQSFGAVPEPASLAGLLTGICGMGFAFKKRR